MARSVVRGAISIGTTSASVFHECVWKLSWPVGGLDQRECEGREECERNHVV